MERADLMSNGQYYKHIMIVNDVSKGRQWLTPQFEA
jgi:hypothetical protein